MIQSLKLQAIVVLGLFSPALLWGAESFRINQHQGETAMIFSADDIRYGRLPARIHEHNVPMVFGSQVRLACLGVPLQKGRLVAYLPQSRRCLMLDHSDENANVEINPGLTTRSREYSSLAGKAEKGTVLILQTAVKPAQTANVCVCPNPDNRPPVTSIQGGSPQEAVAETSIVPILFQATDADLQSLNETFSFKLDGGTSQPGLPAGLSKSCTSESGELNCSVSGTAPLQPALYQIQFTASDGLASDSATAQLTVVAGPQPEQIFNDGFEAAPQ